MSSERVDKLVRQGNLYVFSLTDRYRRWFTRRVLDQVSALHPNATETALENQARTKLIATKQFALGLEQGEPNLNETNRARARRWRRNESRSEAVYGLVGNDITALDDPQRLRSEVERRARTVDRMFYEVGANPNPQGADPNAFIDGHVRAFEYPLTFRDPPPADTVAATLIDVDYKLNQEADQYWREIGNSGVYVLRETADDVRQSLDALFIPFNDYYKRNFLYCQQVIAILHMDALAEVENASLYTVLRERGPAYLRIGEPSDQSFGYADVQIRITGSVDGMYTVNIDGSRFSYTAHGNTTREIRDGLIQQIKHGDLPLHVAAVTDNMLSLTSHYRGAIQQVTCSSTGSVLELLKQNGAYELFFTTETEEAFRYFRQGTADASTLCVGDHVYLRNHPAYEYLTTLTPWAGEHALVTQGMGGYVKFQGHGVPPRTLTGMTNELLKSFQDEVDGAQATVFKHWRSDRELNPDGSFGSLKPPKPDDSREDQNGTTQRLGYGGYPDNIWRDTVLEQKLAPENAYACWYVPYLNPTEERLYLFNTDGSKWKPTPQMIPGLRPGITGMTPPQVWSIRPVQP